MADSALSLPQCWVREYQCHEHDKHTHSETPQNKGNDIFNQFTHFHSPNLPSRLAP